MNPLKRIENMAEYGFADLDLEETANMHEDALALMDEIKQLQSKFEQLKNRYERLADTTEMEQERSLQLQADAERLEEEFQRLCISFALSDDKNELYESFVESRGLEDEFLGFESLKENKNV